MTDQNLQKEEKKSDIGKKVLNLLITEANRRKVSRLLNNIVRTKMIRQVCREHESHLDDILPNALKHIMPVIQPPRLGADAVAPHRTHGHGVQQYRAPAFV